MSVNEIKEPGDDDNEGKGSGSSSGDGQEASFEEFLSKAKGSSDSDEGEEDAVLELTREERLESLSIRAAPKQPNEFVCSSCRLVKHRSQMAERSRELCRDCV
ncbi:MAG: DUF4193 family protein [Actinomycetota bacterium]